MECISFYNFFLVISFIPGNFCIYILQVWTSPTFLTVSNLEIHLRFHTQVSLSRSLLLEILVWKSFLFVKIYTIISTIRNSVKGGLYKNSSRRIWLCAFKQLLNFEVGFIVLRFVPSYKILNYLKKHILLNAEKKNPYVQCKAIGCKLE